MWPPFKHSMSLRDGALFSCGRAVEATPWGFAAHSGWIFHSWRENTRCITVDTTLPSKSHNLPFVLYHTMIIYLVIWCYLLEGRHLEDRIVTFSSHRLPGNVRYSTLCLHYYAAWTHGLFAFVQSLKWVYLLIQSQTCSTTAQCDMFLVLFLVPFTLL